MKINPRRFYASFPESIIDEGRKIFRRKGVLNIKNQDDELTATVIDGSKRFKVNLWEHSLHDSSTIHFECECWGGNCKHIAATMIYLMNQEANKKSFDSQHWLSKISSKEDAPLPSKDIEKSAPLYSLLYILFIKDHSLHVGLQVSRNLKNGGYGVCKTYNEGQKEHRKSKTQVDEKICFQLSWNSRTPHIMEYPLVSTRDEEVLKKIIGTGRCFYLSKDNPPLEFNEPLELSSSWLLNEDGTQKLTFNVENQQCYVVKIHHTWYINPNGSIGIAKASMDNKTLGEIITMPPVPPRAIKSLYHHMKEVIPNLPQPITNIVEDQADYQPIPCLYFYTSWIEVEIDKDMSDFPPYITSYKNYERQDIIAAEIRFKYDDNLLVSIDSDDVLFYVKKMDVLSEIKRNFTFEMQKEKEIKEKFDLYDINAHPDAIDCPSNDYHSIYIGNDQESTQFSSEILPQIKEQGWEVYYEDGCSLEVLHAEDLEWFSELEESEYDWFGMNLGFVIDGEKINLLPLIVNFLKTHNIYNPDKLSLQEEITVQSKNGKKIIIPTDRFKGILGVLSELYDANPLNPDGLLQMNNLSASQLADLERIVNVDNFSWLGSQTIKNLGNKINGFTTVKEVALPDTFKATLRPYQQDGVNWLRFLNNFNLGGILADDMGLGKTIQTLACLCIEKQNNPSLPSIIISPTSLVANWHMEIERFTTGFNTLVLHGHDRKKYFDEMHKYDLIITSYPLILRDKDVMKNQSFNYVILDEAQYIKNYRAKSTKVIFDLKAKHKLCLSGTPMENHLGELWSQFRFLAPGLLGSAEKFTRIFRTPIEKYKMTDRTKSLANRIKPFMLRRTKNQVAIDLPEKTQIIKTTSLEGSQRDLYESIRASMDKKVREAIKTQGFNRSQIIVIDALLKLRQTCCDPRLLNIDSAKKAHGNSAKLDLLMQMIPHLIEEGRKIIIFSQFTSMIEIIKETFDKNHIQYVTLTGKTKNRKAPIDAFQNANIPVIIISLKAGGVGLNLTAADTVIHYDPWWNPAAENQATDRAHRIGQDKPVFVYKLIAEGSVEETIIQMQENKRDIVDGLLSQNQNAKKPLQSSDLKELFKPL